MFTGVCVCRWRGGKCGYVDGWMRKQKRTEAALERGGGWVGREKGRKEFALRNQLFANGGVGILYEMEEKGGVGEWDKQTLTFGVNECLPSMKRPWKSTEKSRRDSIIRLQSLWTLGEDWVGLDWVWIRGRRNDRAMKSSRKGKTKLVCNQNIIGLLSDKESLVLAVLGFIHSQTRGWWTERRGESLLAYEEGERPFGPENISENDNEGQTEAKTNRGREVKGKKGGREDRKDRGRQRTSKQIAAKNSLWSHSHSFIHSSTGLVFVFCL